MTVYVSVSLCLRAVLILHPELGSFRPGLLSSISPDSCNPLHVSRYTIMFDLCLYVRAFE